MSNKKRLKELSEKYPGFKAHLDSVKKINDSVKKLPKNQTLDELNELIRLNINNKTISWEGKLYSFPND